jgi:hypothetical protein
MLLGQLVAVSVASNLFYVALLHASSWSSQPLSRDPKSTPKTTPPSVYLPVLMSLLTVAASPYTGEHTFLPNLLLMHGLLIIPLLFPSTSASTVKPIRFSINVGTLYILITLLCLAIRTKTINIALASLPDTSNVSDLTRVFNGAVYETIYSHPAQSSISWDVVWTTCSLVVWVLIGSLNRSWTDILVTFVGIPMDGVGVVAPWVFRKETKRIESKKE